MKSKLALAMLLAISTAAYAQDADKAPALSKERAAELQASERLLKADSQVSKTGQVTIKGKVVPYKVTAGTQPM
jgi:hypothetical protein